MQICPFSKFNQYEALSLTASTLMHRLVLSIELGTVQAGTGMVDLARKLKCTMAARARRILVEIRKRIGTARYWPYCKFVF